jgi:hypothetical protein
VQVADSGAVYRKYKASVEISSGGRDYTEDSGIGCFPNGLKQTTDSKVKVRYSTVPMYFKPILGKKSKKLQ